MGAKRVTHMAAPSVWILLHRADRMGSPAPFPAISLSPTSILSAVLILQQPLPPICNFCWKMRSFTSKSEMGYPVPLVGPLLQLQPSELEP